MEGHLFQLFAINILKIEKVYNNMSLAQVTNADYRLPKNFLNHPRLIGQFLMMIFFIGSLCLAILDYNLIHVILKACLNLELLMGAFILLMTQDRYQILVKPNILLLGIEIFQDIRASSVYKIRDKIK